MSFVIWSSHIGVNSVVNSVPNLIEQNPLVYANELFTTLNSLLQVQLNLQTYQSSFTIRISGSGKLMHYLSWLYTLRNSVVLYLKIYFQ